jgi:hypothetical protein
MAVRKWVKIPEYAAMNNVKPTRAYQIYLSKKNYDFVKKGYIDENYFLRIHAFKKKMWLKSHEIYYELMEYIGYDDSKLARLVSKVMCMDMQQVRNYFADRMFRLFEFNPYGYNVSDISYLVYRGLRWIRAIALRVGEKRYIKKG